MEPQDHPMRPERYLAQPAAGGGVVMSPPARLTSPLQPFHRSLRSRRSPLALLSEARIGTTVAATLSSPRSITRFRWRT